MVEVRQLQYFLALSCTQNFARAAEAQHITQSALSQQIARLERELGVTLFERGVRGATLTDAGAQLLVQAERVLAELTELQAHAASISRDARVELRVGSPTYAVRSRARQRVLGVFAESQPRVDVRFENAWSPQLLEALTRGELDLSFAMLAPENSDLEFILLQDEPSVLIVPEDHCLAQREAVGLEDLAGERVLLYPRDVNAWMYERMSSPLQQAGVLPAELEESSLPAVLDQVRDGAGVFPAVPWEMDFVNPEQLEGLALVGTSGEPGLRYQLWLARRHNTRTPMIEAFWEAAQPFGIGR